MKRRGFTLIELLIVVAIIAILAAIAVPNFLEAQVRSKVSRVKNDLRVIHTTIMAYYIDYNDIGIRDGNDADTPDWRIGRDVTTEMGLSGGGGGVKWYNSGDMQFYSFATFRCLTTPVAYITSIPTDPFTTGVPFGVDTRGLNSDSGKFYIDYAVVASAGPDGWECDWGRWNSPTGKAILYDATNGTKSRGDLWRIVSPTNSELFKHEYGENYY